MSEADKTGWWASLGPWRIPLAIVGGICLLSLVARLDPGYKQREAEREAAKAERAAERARVAALMPEAGKAGDGVRRIDFGDLAFKAAGGETPATTSKGYAQWAPENVKALDGRAVRIEGFMLPTKVEQGRASECLILANQMACCYGNTPTFCEFLVARMKGTPAAVLQDQTLVFTGTLHVGDVFEDKAWVAFYTLDVTEVGRK